MIKEKIPIRGQQATVQRREVTAIMIGCIVLQIKLLLLEEERVHFRVML